MSETVNLAQIELLARVGLFAGLDRIALAKLVAYLEPLPIADGVAVCHQGDPADGLYIIVRGTFGAFAIAPDGGATRVATFRPGDFFGEMALLTNEPRAATVRAEGAGEVLRLESGRFLQLCRGDAAIAFGVAATLSQRLRASDQVYLERDQLIDQRLGQLLGRISAAQREQLFRAGLLETESGEALRALFGDEAEAVAHALAVLGPGGNLPDGQILPALRRHIATVLGPDALAALVDSTVSQLAGANCWDAALAIVARQGPRARFVALLAAALRGTPPLTPEQAAPWLELLADEEAVDDVELALGKAAVLAARGNLPAAISLLRRALSQAMVAGEMTAVQRLTTALSQETAPETTGVAEHAPAEFAERAHRRYPAVTKLGAGLAAVGFAVGAALSTQQQLTFVLLLAAAITLWANRLLPDFAVSFGLVAAWLLYGLATPAQAASGFASTDWLFALSVFGLAAAIARSGLLFRVGLLFVRRLPQGLFWQAATLLATGLILMPLLPSNSGRLAMTMPLALAVAEASRLQDRSPASAMLGLAAWIGSTPLMFIFLNASSLCLLAWGLLPPASKQRFDWFHWFGAAAPLGLIIGLGMLVALPLLLRPEGAARPERARVAVQLAVLGPPSRREWAMIATMALMAIGWFGGPAIGLNAGVVAVAGLLLATVAGNFDGQALQALDWNYLIFYGVALSIARLGVTLGVDQRAASRIGGPLSRLGLSPFLFILLLAALSLVVRLVLPENLGVLLLGLSFIPVAPVIGVEPWIVIVVLLATSALWFFPAQTPYYLFALSASEDRLFAHAQARRLAFAYAVVALLGLVLTFPYWRWLGLV